MVSFLSRPTGARHTRVSLLLALGMAATVGTALAFEHFGGFIPCALCLEQRMPYYIAVPVALLAALAAAGRAPAIVTRGALLIVALLMLYGLYLGVFHAGVEWGYWAGPADCAAVAGDLSGNVLSQIDRVRPPSCEEAAGRFLGLSFAGWNVLASALFAAIAGWAAFARANRFA